MPFVYMFGAMQVCSVFALPGLRARHAAPDCTSPVIRLCLARGARPDAVSEVFRWPGRYGLTLASRGQDWLLTSARDGAFFITDQGRCMRCFPDPRSTSSSMREVIVRRILPRLAQWHGRLALHAAAVSDGQGAMLLLGPSGAGKSTLSAALSDSLGWQIFSDDSAILHGEAYSLVSPAATGVCLWPDSLAALHVPPARQQRLTAYENKCWYASADELLLPAQPVRACLFLTHPSAAPHPLDTVRARRMPPSTALVCLMRQLVRFNPTDRTAEAHLLQSLSKLAALVPMYELAYPRAYEQLPLVAELLQDMMRHTAGSPL